MNVDYKILKSISLETLERVVIEHLKKGYIAQGGVFKDEDKYWDYFCQVVVKHEDKEEHFEKINEDDFICKSIDEFCEELDRLNKTLDRFNKTLDRFNAR